MNTELTKPQKVILIRGGIEIWLDADKAAIIEQQLVTQSTHNFIRLKDLGQTVNTADIVGIFTPDAIEGKVRRRAEQWQCAKGKWHAKNESCDCWLGTYKPSEYGFEEKI